MKLLDDKHHTSLKPILLRWDRAAFRRYLNDYYKDDPQYSDATIERLMHEWVLRIYLVNTALPQEFRTLYENSILWLADYIKRKEIFHERI